MNRCISTNLAGIGPESLPPAASQGPVRMLFIHGNILGFKNVAAQLKEGTAGREDVDAVHIDLEAPTWMKVLGKSIPGLHGWDHHQDRHLRLWGRVIDGWFRGPLDLRHFDVVHLMTQVNAWAMVRWRRRQGEGRGARPRFVVNIDSTAALEVKAFGMPAASRAAFRRAEQHMFDQADLIGCRNAWAASSPAPDYGVPADRVHAAVNSIEMPEAQRDWSAPRAADAPVRLVFVGTAWHRKGGDLVVEALRRVKTPCELHVVGADASILGGRTEPGIVFHGRVERDTLRRELLPSMDAFILASRFDMLPWAILEGAAAGLPVIAPRTGAIPDVVRPGETGELFEPGDVAGLAAAIDAVVADADVLRQRGEAAAEHVRTNFDASRTYPAYLDRLVALAGPENGS
ncbi:MAG: glycosyltransferase family 4 protein [Phycisphaerales bacterium]